MLGNVFPFVLFWTRESSRGCGADWDQGAERLTCPPASNSLPPLLLRLCLVVVARALLTRPPAPNSLLRPSAQ